MKEKVEVVVVVRKPDDVEEDKARTKIPAPDAAREIARKAAKARWASWAGKKAM
ncbi:MAG: hypothetical protein ABSG84_16065 [Acidobacteriaceae bacterium]|jgi:hypothetical protein